VVRECQRVLSDYKVPIAMMEAMAAGLVPIWLDVNSRVREVLDYQEVRYSSQSICSSYVWKKEFGSSASVKPIGTGIGSITSMPPGGSTHRLAYTKLVYRLLNAITYTYVTSALLAQR